MKGPDQILKDVRELVCAWHEIALHYTEGQDVPHQMADVITAITVFAGQYLGTMTASNRRIVYEKMEEVASGWNYESSV